MTAPQARLGRLEAPELDLTRPVLLRSQPITAGDSTSDREVRDEGRGKARQAVPVFGRAGGEAGSSVRPCASANEKTPTR